MVNIVALLVGATRPHVAQLGRLPGTDEFRDLGRFPDLQPVPEVLLVRLDAALFFVNAAWVKDLVLALAADTSQPTRAVVLDLETVPFVDFTGCQALEELRKALERRGIALAVANPIGPVRDQLHRYGLGPHLKLDRAHLDIPSALDVLGRGGPRS